MKLDKLLEALNCAGINQDDVEVESINDSERFYTAKSNDYYLGVWDDEREIII